MATETDKQKQESVLITKSGKPYVITAEGSLGLLAMGYEGLMLWRQKRKELSQIKAES